ncbi:hypothetical protein MTHERMMSTA1_09330 [Methanosarcina thermophila MST-A1]|uniref:CHASE4 domain-containing protein n=1 Tax=Methanosarcina thermophila TaxID=2210 RepID=UPI0022EE0E8E|nr:hypothetical protein MTHERMMSTA1_09330 [Methanosarcina thermophila MST-A1]
MQHSKFLELEHEDTLENVERIQNAISTEQKYIDRTAHDWACWDDTYKFIKDRNLEYIYIKTYKTRPLQELRLM